MSPEKLIKVIENSVELMGRYKEAINRLNVYPVPDGDTGTNLYLTLVSVLDEARAHPEKLTDLRLCAQTISRGALLGARGNSGVILSQIIRGFVEGVLRADELGQGIARGLIYGAGRGSELADAAVLRPVEGTILTVARRVAESASELDAEDVPLNRVIEALRTAGRAALLETTSQLSVLAEANVVDAGGAGFLIFIDALGLVFGDSYEPLDHPWFSSEVAIALGTSDSPRDYKDISDLKYEVMYLLEANETAIGGFREVWAGIGDSIVVVGQDGLWNCHIHTDDVGAAIEAGIEAGKPKHIRVTDLSEQVREEQWVIAAHGEGAPDPFGVSDQGAVTAVVAVANGEGVGRIFRSMGVNRIVIGGQSMNPSTLDILSAIDELESEQVIVLPNNPNIVPVAKMAADLSSRMVKVLPTKGVVEGFAALMEFDPAADIDDNLVAMGASVEKVATGEVTRAVRAATWSGGEIAKGDFLGMNKQGIVAVGGSLVAAATKLLALLLTSESEIVTIIEGEGSTMATTREITEWLSSEYSGIEIEIHHGGQPLYPYLFGVE